MYRFLCLASALALGLFSHAAAQKNTGFAEGTPVVIVGQISSPPKGEINEQKMQVAVGPQKTDYTVHFSDAHIYDKQGGTIDEDGLDSGHWVRAEGWVMNDPRRIKVSRLWVIGDKSMTGLTGTVWNRQGHSRGYVMRAQEPLAEARAEPRYPEGTPVEVVGQVSSPPAGELNEQKMQVAVGPQKTDYTLHFNDAQLTGLQGQKIDEDGLDNGQWVHAWGTVMDDPRRIKVTSLHVVAPKGPASQLNGTRYSRRGFEAGYVMSTRPEGYFPAATTVVTTPAGSTRAWAEGTPVVVVGPISSPPKGELNEQKMQVAIGPRRTDYTIHFGDAEVIGLQGQRIDEDGLDHGQWVRAEGTVMDDRRRIKATRVQVIAPDNPGFTQSAFARPGYTHGYVMSTAGTRQTFPVVRTVQPFGERQMVLIGRISDDTGAFQSTRSIQVDTAGNEWTLNVPESATVLDAKAERLSVHEMREGQWVRVQGWQTDDLRMRVERIENIGADEAFRASTFYRTDWPMGYVEYTVHGTAPTGAIGTATYSGTVVAIDRNSGFLTLRDAAGQEHRIDIGRDANLPTLKVGDRVNVRITDERR